MYSGETIHCQAEAMVIQSKNLERLNTRYYKTSLKGRGKLLPSPFFVFPVNL